MPGHVGVLSLATGGESNAVPAIALCWDRSGSPTNCASCSVLEGSAGAGWRCSEPVRPCSRPWTASRIAEIGPYLAHAWREALLSAGSGADPEGRPPAVVVLDANDRIESMTPDSRDLLARLPEGRTAPIADVLHALALAARRGIAVPMPGTAAGVEARDGAAQVMMPPRRRELAAVARRAAGGCR